MNKEGPPTIQSLSYKLGSLQGELDQIRFRDGQLAMTLHHVIEVVEKWHKDATAAVSSAPKSVKDAVLDRVIDTKTVEKLLKDVLNQLLPKDENVKKETSRRTANQSAMP